MRSTFLVFTFALAAGAAPGLRAQACLGLPAFSDASVHLNAAAEFPDSARSYLAGLGAGVENGVFLNLGGGVVTYQGYDERALVGFGELGFQIPLMRAQVCPIAGGYLGAGPDLKEFDLTVTTRGASAGLAFGVPFDLAIVDAIPTAAVKLEYVSQKVEQADAGSLTETTQSGLLDVGLGLVFGDRFTVQPLAHFPFATDGDAEPSFGVFASVILPLPVPGFGR
jgi:hypothetical protein